jgi:hypothetical protein
MNITSKQIKKLQEQGTGLTSTGEVVNSAFLFISKNTMKKIKENGNGNITNVICKNANPVNDTDSASN